MFSQQFAIDFYYTVTQSVSQSQNKHKMGRPFQKTGYHSTCKMAKVLLLIMVRVQTFLNKSVNTYLLFMILNRCICRVWSQNQLKYCQINGHSQDNFLSAWRGVSSDFEFICLTLHQPYRANIYFGTFFGPQILIVMLTYVNNLVSWSCDNLIHVCS